MEAAILFGLFVLFSLAATHPFATYPLSIFALRKFRGMPVRTRANPCPGTASPAPDAAPHSALCFCAYNEAHVIHEKMENVRQLRRTTRGRLDVLVYVDASTDGTTDIMREYADEVMLLVSSVRHGKSYGMNRLVERAAAPMLVFTDANVMLEYDAINNLWKYFQDPEIGCVCGSLLYTNSLESVTAEVSTVYWNMEERIKQAESDTGSVMGADGSIFAIRRSLHEPVPDDIIDDFYVSIRILCKGHRVVRAGDVLAVERSASSRSEEFQRKVRIACQGVRAHSVLWPQIRRQPPLTLYKYVSHKLLRWVALYNLTLAALCGTLWMVLAFGARVTGAVLALGLSVVALGLAGGVKPVVKGVEVLSALLGASVGVWRSFHGDRFQTWTPAASVRRVDPAPHANQDRSPGGARH